MKALMFFLFLSVSVWAQTASPWKPYIDTRQVSIMLENGDIQFVNRLRVDSSRGILPLFLWLDTLKSEHTMYDSITSYFRLTESLEVDSIEIRILLAKLDYSYVTFGGRGGVLKPSQTGEWKKFRWNTGVVPPTDTVFYRFKYRVIGLWFSVYGPQNGDTVRTVVEMKNINFGDVTAVTEPKTNSASSFTLEQNYPNPFNPTTIIQFSLPAGENVALKIYDILGREVFTLADGYMAKGEHNVSFDGSKLSSGTYFYRLEAGGKVKTGKMLLIK